MSMTMIILASVFSGTLILWGLFLFVIIKLSDRVTETNKQLMILAVGKEAKPETLRALVASQKPPQGKLKGIATKPVKEKEPTNQDFTLNIGGTGGIQI